MKKEVIFLLVLIVIFLVSCSQNNSEANISEEASKINLIYLSCIDSDGGNNPQVIGTTTVQYTKLEKNIKETQKDVCRSEKLLQESYCEDKMPKSKNITCLNGCKDGVCKQKTPSVELSNKCLELFPGHNNLNENRINLVVVGVNYKHIDTSKTLGKITLDLNEEHQGLFPKQPLKSNKDRFNLWYVGELGDTSSYPPRPTPEEEAEQEQQGISWTHPEWLEVERLTEFCPVTNRLTLAFVNTTEGESPLNHIFSVGKTIAPILVPENYAENAGPVSVSFYVEYTLHELGHLLGRLLGKNENIGDEYFQLGLIGEKFVNSTNNYGPATYENCLENSRWHFLVGNGCGEDGIIDCLREVNPTCETLCKSENCENKEEVQQICQKNYRRKNCSLQEMRICRDNPVFTEPKGELEVNCWLGGNGINNIWRPTYNSLMSAAYIDGFDSYGPVNERTLCLAIKKVTSSVSEYCYQFCLEGCEIGQKCVEGECI